MGLITRILLYANDNREYIMQMQNCSLFSHAICLNSFVKWRRRSRKEVKSTEKLHLVCRVSLFSGNNTNTVTTIIQYAFDFNCFRDFV